MTPIMAVKSISRRFGGLRAVADASLEVEAESITALIGPNGAGKTTLFNVMTGFARADRGAVRFQGHDTTRWPPHRIARLGMVRTFQITKVLAAMSVLDNMMLGAQRQPGERLRNLLVHPKAARRSEAAARERAMDLLETFDLAKLATAYAGTLSGGQRKLLEFARALMSQPRLLMLDEPMAGINPTLGLRLMEHIQRLRAERGTTFLFIEHDLEVVMSQSDRVIVMSEGRVIASDRPDEVRNDARVVEAYLGAAAEPTGDGSRA